MAEDIVDRLRIAETALLDADLKVALFLVLQDARAAITRLRAEITRLREERRWIPVEERMPEVDSTVLVSWRYGEGPEQVAAQAWYDRHGRFMTIEDAEFPNVTHWQPLPAPPSEGEVDG